MIVVVLGQHILQYLRRADNALVRSGAFICICMAARRRNHFGCIDPIRLVPNE